MVPLGHALALGAILFAVGVAGVVLRRSALVVLMSVELMLNAANLTLVSFSAARGDGRGLALAFLVIATAAAEAAVGLAIVVAVFRTRRTVYLDEVATMKN